MKMPLLQENTDFLLNAAFQEAQQSDCSKLGFGALLVNDYTSIIEVRAHNGPLIETAWVCEPDCIRLEIPSRTQSMLGACFHAEELAIARGIRKGLDLRNFVLFVIGAKDGKPLYRDNPVFSCIRCATAMVLHRLKGVYLFDGTYWHFQTSEHAYQTAMAYATGQRSI